MSYGLAPAPPAETLTDFTFGLGGPKKVAAVGKQILVVGIRSFCPAPVENIVSFIDPKTCAVLGKYIRQCTGCVFHNVRNVFTDGKFAYVNYAPGLTEKICPKSFTLAGSFVCGSCCGAAFIDEPLTTDGKFLYLSNHIPKLTKIDPTTMTKVKCRACGGRCGGGVAFDPSSKKLFFGTTFCKHTLAQVCPCSLGFIKCTPCIGSCGLRAPGCSFVFTGCSLFLAEEFGICEYNKSTLARTHEFCVRCCTPFCGCSVNGGGNRSIVSDGKFLYIIFSCLCPSGVGIQKRCLSNFKLLKMAKATIGIVNTCGTNGAVAGGFVYGTSCSKVAKFCPCNLPKKGINPNAQISTLCRCKLGVPKCRICACIHSIWGGVVSS